MEAHPVSGMARINLTFPRLSAANVSHDSDDCICGMQVPRSKSVKAHPVSGMARINLTFRRLDLQLAARAPSCKCGQKAVLKVLANPTSYLLTASCRWMHICSAD